MKIFKLRKNDETYFIAANDEDQAKAIFHADYDEHVTADDIITEAPFDQWKDLEILASDDMIDLGAPESITFEEYMHGNERPHMIASTED